MDGDMVDPPNDDKRPADEHGDEQVGVAAGAAAGPGDTAAADATDEPERASEIDDITDSIPRPDDIDYSDVDVAAVLAEREEFKDLAQRVQADFDNYRKRAAAQAQADADRATGRLAEALLPVLDAAEAAYVRHPDEVGPLLNQMLAELKKHGLENLDLEQQPFDPEVAEAVAHEPGDGGEPIVAEVLRSGYLWKGRVLRAAMVKTRD
jgi:molecular chaperone GrpE